MAILNYSMHDDISICMIDSSDNNMIHHKVKI